MTSSALCGLNEGLHVASKGPTWSISLYVQDGPNSFVSGNVATLELLSRSVWHVGVDIYDTTFFLQ